MAFELQPGHTVVLVGKMREPRERMIRLLAQVGVTVVDRPSSAHALIYADVIAGTYQCTHQGGAIVKAGKPCIQENRFFTEHLPRLRSLTDPNRVVALAWPGQQRSAIGF